MMSAMVRPESHETFKHAVLVKWGKIHGVFGDELSNAMDIHAGNHLSHAPHTRTHVDVKERGLKTAERIFARIRRDYDKELSSKVLKAAIRAEAGTDNRTIRRYTSLLVNDLGWIEVRAKGDFDIDGKSGYATIY
ncbi:unnamed protein product, partial [marine sediment metagenome]